MDVQIPYVPTVLAEKPTTFLNIDDDLMNNNNLKTSNKAKCLFGKPDHSDADCLLEEQYQDDRKRFWERFGIDIQEIENISNNLHVVSAGSKKNEYRKIKMPSRTKRSSCEVHRRQFKLTGKPGIFF